MTQHPTDRRSRYLEHADLCRRESARCATESKRDQYLKLALEWEALAQELPAGTKRRVTYKGGQHGDVIRPDFRRG